MRAIHALTGTGRRCEFPIHAITDPKDGYSARLDEKYVSASRELALERIALAGYRLADLLNGLIQK